MMKYIFQANKKGNKTMSAENLKEKTIKGLIVQFISTALLKSLSFIQIIIFARIFAPNDFGIFATASLVVSFVMLFVPWLFVFMYYFPTMPILIGTIVGSAHLTRFVRRTKSKLTKHMNTLNAHTAKETGKST